MRSALCPILMVLLFGVGAFASLAEDLLQIRQDIYAAWPRGVPRQTPELDAWNVSDPDPCSNTWIGVICDESSRWVTSLDLARMDLQGPVPGRVGELANLTDLDLSDNNFSGPLPAGLFNATTLDYLNIGYNSIEGLLPEDIRRLSELTSLHLSGNRLSGTLAPVANSKILTLSMGGNRLTGGLEALENMTEMQYISLEDNQLSGSIPHWIADFANLWMLYLDGNNFTGKIPADLGSRGGLKVLILSHNKLSGRIPAGICANGNVTRLLLHDNMLVGPPPASLFLCPKLGELTLARNQLNGSMDDEAFLGSTNIVFIDMSSNFLHGGIPSTIGSELIQLKTLNLSHNNFTGSISAELLNLPALVTLDLSWNSLSGPFPARAFRGTAALSVLNLSRNNLSGPVPDDLAYWARNGALSWVDLSHNALTGRLPQFPAMNESLFSFNPDLCSDNATLQLRACVSAAAEPPASPAPLEQQSNSSASSRSWVAAVAASLAAFVVVAGAILCFCRRRSLKNSLQNPDLIAAMQEGDNAVLMSFKTLHKATDGFSESAQIGRGGFGTVYKGVLPDGTVVAIKRSRQCHEESAEKRQFLNEVRILMQLKHRNLVRLLGCCLEKDNALLVLEYVPCGTLADHIQGQELSWRQRLRIAVQTADALFYLHTSANTPIFHRDMKPANILLDHNLNAKVADFGISRLVSLDVTHVTTDAIQGTPGYIDPEYYQTYKLTGKSDVYSFGVILLQILTAKAVIDHSRGPYDSNLVKMADHLLSTDCFDIILDSSLVEVYNRGGKDQESILGVARLAIRCVQLNPRDRPTMREVLLKFAGISRNIYPESVDDISLQSILSGAAFSIY